MFRPVSADIDFVAIEETELARWRDNEIFQRSVARREGAPPWIFFEGPPTANGQPGLHHVWARVYKDLFCRYQTMRGRYVARRAGWDTHGLAVEVEVEKRLGISGKRAIEDVVGVAEFTRLCRESVHVYINEFERLTERIGYWLDFDEAYYTYSTTYVESVWWHLQQLFNRDLLYEDLKVIPYCTRCGTPLSSHELGQPDVYRDEVDQSCFVALAVRDAEGRPGLEGVTHLAVWTTTPWTLLSNVAIAVNPEVTYAVVNGYVVAEALVESVFGEGSVPSARFPGRALLGLHYERPFDDVALPPNVDANYVVAASYVSTDDGTGLVHQAPAFGEIDRQVARDNGLPTVNPVGPDGAFTSDVTWLEGRNVRDANVDINDELERRGLLLRRLDYEHSLPHCWRCGTILIYWGKPSWYIATSSFKQQMLAGNATIDWHPAHIRDGRFGEWLANNVDWALSRDRYWGTPLPIWRCDDGHLTCVGSLAELSDLTGRDLSELDPHRPAIDDVVVPCPSCHEDARRVSPVIDAWFDSGAMPAAQVGFPHVAGSRDAVNVRADFIAEAIDQTRGWFYSLLAVNTLVFDTTPYEHVLCLGHIVEEDGRKMSKSLGNVIDPWKILDSRGADPLRWWMFSQGSPWTPTRATMASIDISMRETLVTLWNVFSFFTTYASLNQFDVHDDDTPPRHERTAIDRWILSRADAMTTDVTTALDSYEPLGATVAISEFVDDVSNWYVRRSRRRFWRTDPDAPRSDSLAAHATLWEALSRLSVVLAPFCPFLADYMHHELHVDDETGSVHLVDWPTPSSADRDEDLEVSMAVARRLSSLGRKARKDANVKVRQPLGRAVVFVPAGTPAPPFGIVEDELNVDVLDYDSQLGDVLSFELVANFRTLGPRLGESAKEVRGALAHLDAAAVAEKLERGETVELALSSGLVTLGVEDVDLRVKNQSGFAVSREGSEVVALDLTLDDSLRHRGLVRDLVRQVQEIRKTSAFDVSDRITLHLVGLDDVQDDATALASEVLATRIIFGPGVGPGSALDFDDDRDARAWVTRS